MEKNTFSSRSILQKSDTVLSVLHDAKKELAQIMEKKDRFEQGAFVLQMLQYISSFKAGLQSGSAQNSHYKKELQQ